MSWPFNGLGNSTRAIDNFNASLPKVEAYLRQSQAWLEAKFGAKVFWITHQTEVDGLKYMLKFGMDRNIDGNTLDHSKVDSIVGQLRAMGDVKFLGRHSGGTVHKGADAMLLICITGRYDLEGAARTSRNIRNGLISLPDLPVEFVFGGILIQDDGFVKFTPNPVFAG